ncbi:UvrD-helicase domain-containing protein [Burkholderia ambifaria]|uniref:UvrD-helicase domain-containing protein n=1 Tax=Burkholderia ambifaria TaxID=152480 RepID=UPI00158F33DE|nr:UvrD-helicase domain-containing protein [Burkholderia ambifaria]
MNNFSHILITEAALDLMLIHNIKDEDGMPKVDVTAGIASSALGDTICGFFTASDTENSYSALIDIVALHALLGEATGDRMDAYRRIARVVKGLRNPPIHLPRQWSEYHHKNLIAFFALPKSASDYRWIAEADGENRCIRFEDLSSRSSQVDLVDFRPKPWPAEFATAIEKLAAIEVPSSSESTGRSVLAEEVDLQAIGSGSVVRNRTYEEWSTFLSESQKKVLDQQLNASVRIVGPAGSGKTLALCLRAVQIARNVDVQSTGKRVLIATHSWAMAERIDGVLAILNGGVTVEGITVFPLLSLLQMHAGNIGQQRIEVIGDDSTSGRIKAIDIIKDIVSAGRIEAKNVSKWIEDGLAAPENSKARLELLFNIYEEISGVLTASAVALDDPESVRSYLKGVREDWMPPFVAFADRAFVIGVYREFIRALVDRSSITTDQFVLDSIRVLETFTWRMRKETDGYDYILVDELQLFDSQERAALELLGRSRKGVPFITAEDPSQGVFSSLHSSRGLLGGQTSVYLETVHRFDKKIFELISFIYQKFPLNSLPLKIDAAKSNDSDAPRLHLCETDHKSVDLAVKLIEQLLSAGSSNNRICVATLGDVDEEICSRLDAKKIAATRLASFDDVEQLAYRKRSVIVAPWQFIGGTQFSHVIVVATGLQSAQTGFGRLRELTAVYLACSRATKSLNVVCAGYVPQVLRDAKEHALIQQIN